MIESNISSTAPPEGGEKKPLSEQLYFNRELSWLAFNRRVLDEACNVAHPLLERLRFLSISANNLDEFFMVRVSGLREQLKAGVVTRSQDGLTPAEQLVAIGEAVHALTGDQQARWAELRHDLHENRIHLLQPADIGSQDRIWLEDYFLNYVFPVLTPLAVGLGRPFPYISNLSLSLAVLVRDPVSGHVSFARVKVPKEMLPRFVALEAEPTTFVPLEELIAANLTVDEIRDFLGVRMAENPGEFLGRLAAIGHHFDTITPAAVGLSTMTLLLVLGTNRFVKGIPGTVVGLFIPAVLQAGFVIIVVESFWQGVAVGTVLVAAVYVDQSRRAATLRGAKSRNSLLAMFKTTSKPEGS